MCIIFIAYGIRPDHPLVLLANRDEFYNRPTAPAAWWEDAPGVFAGRDLVAGGTWLGVTRGGRFAAVTNYRDPKAKTGTLSRGALVADFLKGNENTPDHMESIKARKNDYSGFNLLAGEINGSRKELFYFSNREGLIKELQPGTYGLSNHLLDTAWPKVASGKARFDALIKQKNIDKDGFFNLLADEAIAPDANLPDTGMGLEIERALSSIFIKTPGYGTRCSTILTIDKEFRFDLDERVFV